MRIAMIGTRGIPAKYGGFETAAEEIGSRLVQRGHEIVIYGSDAPSGVYRGMHIVRVPALRTSKLETLTRTAFASLHSLARSKPDVALVFNAANAPYLPLLQSAGIPTAVNMDGLEWRRSKWTGAGARYYLWAERFAAKHARKLIADSTGIAEYLFKTHGRRSDYIPYGATKTSRDSDLIKQLGLTVGGYHLAVARFEPENHVLEIVQSYARSACRVPLIVVGDAPYSKDYVAKVKAAGTKDPRIKFLGSVWDQRLLDQLYACALSYIHGHSVGGTNPSLLRAMGAGAPVVALDVSFNREVAGNAGQYFDAGNPESLSGILMATEMDPTATVQRGAVGQADILRRYSWDDVAIQYEQVCLDLLSAGSRATS